MRNVDLVIVFIDLTRYDVQSQSLPAMAVAPTIDRFYEIVGDHVAAAKGILVKFIGDAALIVFPADAVNEAVEMLLRMQPEIDALMTEAGWECRFAAKVHVGPVVEGQFGARGAKRYDVIGKAVNIAARLKAHGISVTADVRRRLRPPLEHRVSPPDV